MPTAIWPISSLIVCRESSFSGVGARRHGGRWNPKNIPAVTVLSIRASGLDFLVRRDANDALLLTRFDKSYPKTAERL
jgi:hypothetical protein